MRSTPDWLLDLPGATNDENVYVAYVYVTREQPKEREREREREREKRMGATANSSGSRLENQHGPR